MSQAVDVLVVGGGINGAAIARDAAGRGARVALVERDDLAGHTSSASTKLVHGGLRYLEHYEFRLVGEALAERERLMTAAPHLIRPLEFILPHNRQMRPAWIMRIGLLLYDRLGGRSRLPRSRPVRLDVPPYAGSLDPHFRKGFRYADCWGDDSRLVVANAQDASERGANVMLQTEVLRARQEKGLWQVVLRSPEKGEFSLEARGIVNATGAWAADFLRNLAGAAAVSPLRLIKGSHIVTRRLFGGDHAFLLQNPDGRVIFAIPYETDFTLIGTTDIDWAGPRGEVRIDPEEVDYLCAAVNRWLATKITPADVVSSYAGLRPLYDDDSADPSAISRDYVLSLDAPRDAPFLLSVFGGKITTHRALAESAVDMVAPLLGVMRPAWTAQARLPGGDLGPRGLAGLIEEISRQWPFLDGQSAERIAQSYGSRASQWLGGAKGWKDLGMNFGCGLTEAEVRYLIKQEWARTVDDILWRRSKLGLRFDSVQKASLETYLESETRAVA